MRRRVHHRFPSPFRRVVACEGFIFRATLIASITLILCSGPARTARAVDGNKPPIEYNQDVRPILVEKCFECHGPDSASRESDLRLDIPPSPKNEGHGPQAIVPGSPSESLAYLRIISSDKDERMPKDAFKKRNCHPTSLDRSRRPVPTTLVFHHSQTATTTANVRCKLDKQSDRCVRPFAIGFRRFEAFTRSKQG